MSLATQVRCWVVYVAALTWASLAFGAPPVDWALPQLAYRVAVAVDPGDTPRKQAPVGVEIDFAQLGKSAGIMGQVDRHSLRVVEYDPQTKQSVLFEREPPSYEIPYQLTGDFPNDAAGRVWWRMRDSSARHFHLYFDTTSARQHTPPPRLGLVGIGDSFCFNNGQPGRAPTHPLHSQYWHLDWDGDGRRDLLGFAFRRYEYGVPLERNIGNGIYFLKNLGTSERPLFAPRYRLKADDGAYLQTDLLPQNMFPIDWNRDGLVDFIGVDGRKNLLLWENSGRRDRAQLYQLKQPRTLTSLAAVSDFRAQATGVIRKPSFYIRAVSPVDWHGDGGRDLIVSWSNTNILAKVDSKRGVIPYGAPLMIFELYEDIASSAANGTDATAPQFAPPRVITEERGLPIHATTYASGGVVYHDWDGDGDCDLLFQDVTNRPLEGGRLMFAENVGTRAEPLLMMPIPIHPIDDSPQLVDWNDDGLLDLIAGGEFFANTNRLTGGSTPRAARAKTAAGTRLPRAWRFPQLESRGPQLQIQPEMLGHWATSADWNGDGRLDIVRGMTSRVQVFINRGSHVNPVFEAGVDLMADGRVIDLPNWLDLQADPPHDRGPQGMGEAKHAWLNPTVVDFDRDGDLDLFITSQRWQTLYFENTGTRQAPVLARPREVRYRGNPQEFSWRSKVSAGDLDADGRLELVVTSDEDNVFYAYQPAAQQPDAIALECDTRRALKLDTGEPVQGWYGGQNNNGDNHSLLVDWDADGDLDLINGTLWHIYYYENVGTTTAPRFKAHGKMQLAGQDLAVYRHAGSVDAADWNDDGRLDLVVSTENPSDQPLGEVIHLFDRALIDGDLPQAKLGKIEQAAKK